MKKKIPPRLLQKSKVLAQANALQSSGQYAQARTLYRQLLDAEPRNTSLMQCLGVVEMELDQFDAAMEWMEQSIALEGHNANYFSNYAVLLLRMKRFEAALLCCDTALAIDPHFAAAHSNRGNALLYLGQLDQALQSNLRARALAPETYSTALNLALILKRMGDVQGALRELEYARALAPHAVDVRWTLALLLLLMGKMERGWQEYEVRFLYRGLKIERIKHPAPLWNGRDSLVGKTLFVHQEQGFGDMLQFCRYALVLAHSGTKVLLEVPLPLRGLFAPFVAQQVRIVEPQQVLPPVDYQCPVMSLPLLLGTTLETIPATIPASASTAPRYLDTPPERLTQWQQRIGSKTHAQGLRIGLAWSGNPAHSNDYNRSVALHTLLEHLPRLDELPPGSGYFSLQRDLRESDWPAIEAHTELQNFGLELRDFSDTAAVCDLMDVVISVDTSIAHLSAALGRPTCILLPFDPDWRWLLERSDSPWYPSVRLYRKSLHGGWAEPIIRLAHDLRAGRLPG